MRRYLRNFSFLYNWRIIETSKIHYLLTHWNQAIWANAIWRWKVPLVKTVPWRFEPKPKTQRTLVVFSFYAKYYNLLFSMLFSSAPRQNSSVRISLKQIRPFVPVLLHHIFNEFFYLYGVFTFWREMFHLSSSEFSSRSLLILSYLSCGIEFHEHWIYVNVFMHATTPPRPDSSWRRLHRMGTVNIFPNNLFGSDLGQTGNLIEWKSFDI